MMRIVYVTTESVSQAQVIGRGLIEKQLAACVNILPGMKSIYRWEGRLEQAEEAVLLVKTRAELAESVVEEVKKVHSYSVPCAMVLEVAGGNTDYLNWIVQSCR
jgi:periplasmic divalent cation tolerance protein